MRIGIAGIAIESSTFSPHRAGADDFDVRRGDALLQRYDFLGKEWAHGVEWVPLVHARSLPGGAVVAEFYDDLSAEIVERIGTAGDLDGLFFDIHGAMSVVGREDAEGGPGHPGARRARTGRDDLDLDGPARQRVARAGFGCRSDHLLPDGAARGRDGEPGADSAQPRGAPAVRTGQAEEGLDPGTSAAPGREDLDPDRARRLASTNASARSRTSPAYWMRRSGSGTRGPTNRGAGRQSS